MQNLLITQPRELDPTYNCDSGILHAWVGSTYSQPTGIFPQGGWCAADRRVESVNMRSDTDTCIWDGYWAQGMSILALSVTVILTLILIPLRHGNKHHQGHNCCTDVRTASSTQVGMSLIQIVKIILSTIIRCSNSTTKRTAVIPEIHLCL